jgi:AbrB family looped-hinge helix DNA binding protein
MSTVVKISNQRQIRIPKIIMNALKIAPGDYIEVDVENGQVVLKPRKLIDPSQGWYWTKEWQQTEAGVDEELENKQRSPVFQTADEGLKWLDK